MRAGAFLQFPVEADVDLLVVEAGEAGDLLAFRPLTEALRIAERTDDRVAQFYLLAAFGCRAALSGRARAAARLLGASETARARVGASRVLFLGAVLGQSRQTAAAVLGEAGFGTEFAAGKCLSREAALSLALGRDAGAAAGESGTEPPAQPLSRREADVARLVADGLTNRQIGTRLLISERTVDSHVRGIMNKLCVGSRAKIAAWVTAAGG